MRKSPAHTQQGGGKIGRSVLAASMAVAALAASVTGAYFTDSEASTGNKFVTGDVDIAAPTSAIVTQANMAPGDVQIGEVVVSNSGSLEMRYALSSTTNGDADLAAQLDLVIWAESAETTSDGTCATTAPATTLYGAADLGSTTGLNVIGDPAQGDQGSDRVLAAAASETLCFRVELPTTTGNSFESLTTSAEFTFAAEQTANNA